MTLSSLLHPSHFRGLLNMLGLAALGALGFALVGQYGFGLKPCHLCLWQRAPYGALIVIGALAELWRAAPMRYLVPLALGLLLVEIGIAGYHSALERHLVTGPAECSGGIEKGMDLDALRAKILGAAVTRCDEPVWMVPGISMANGNLILAIALFAYGVAHARRLKKESLS